ncbi:MAG: hypothetical protein PS018_22995 [bacterium]|nr:hypothetical protein [bacterium]
MHDLVVVVVSLAAYAAIGFPLCFLLPEQRFGVRFAIAPPLGFGMLAIGATALYPWGIRPWVSLLAMAGTGIAFGTSLLLRAGIRRPLLSSNAIRLVATTVIVTLICLAPGWTGGAKFRVFQANPYDQMVYLGGSMTFRTVDHASMMAETGLSAPDPIVAKSAWYFDNRGAVSVVHAAIAGVTGQSIVDSFHPFLSALQANMLFAALFILVNVFAVGYRLSLLLASALTVGFFQQYVFDINSWSQLAAQPLYPLIVAFAVLAFERDRFSGNEISGAIRLAAMFGVLLGAVLYLYPEAFAVYGPALAAVPLLALGQRVTRRAALFGVTGLGLGTCLAVLFGLLFWTGTLEYAHRQLTNAAGNPPDWWKYFSQYLFGSEQNYLDVLTDPGNGPGQIAMAWFSLPVESLGAALGLYFVLPGASWPIALAIAWKIALYGFLGLLLKGAADGIIKIWRTNPAGSAVRMTGACIAACLVPPLILWLGHAWAAGKGLSMAAPMLFLLVAGSLLSKPDMTGRNYGRLAALAFVFAHLVLGLLRPILVSDFAGNELPGLPTAAAQMRSQKATSNWDHTSWDPPLRKCSGIVVDVANPFMHQYARRVAFDLGIPWAAAATNWPDRSRHARWPDGWQDFECVASTSTPSAKPGQKLIWLDKDRSVLDYLRAQHIDLEIGTRSFAGVSSAGVHGTEATAAGPLQWTAPTARFEVPNNLSSPAKTLRLELWPMPIASERLKLTVNGDAVYDGAVPASAVTIPLDRFAVQDKLAIELSTSGTTRYPNDPRDLGVAIRGLGLGK